MRVSKLFLTMVCLALCTTLGWAGEPVFESQVTPGPKPQVRVVPAPPGCGVIDVDVWTNRSTFRNGDPVCIYIRADEDAFLYVYSTDGNGITRQLLPNYWDCDNFVRRHQTLRLPDRSYDLLASGSGWDTIHVIAVSAYENDWHPPGRFKTYSSSNPYPSWSSVDSARGELMSAMPQAVSNDQSHQVRESRSYYYDPPESQVRVEPRTRVRPVRNRGGYGEAYTHIYVKPRVYRAPIYCPPEPVYCPPRPCPPRCSKPCCRKGGVSIRIDVDIPYHSSYSYRETHTTYTSNTCSPQTELRIERRSVNDHYGFDSARESRSTKRIQAYDLPQSRVHQMDRVNTMERNRFVGSQSDRSRSIRRGQ